MTASSRDRPVTRTDVARRAGVSSAVVSYVVNSGPRNVAPETRERVLQAIEELGYRPNASARALKRGVSETIGLIISDITNPFFSEYAHAIEEAAAERGLSVIFTNSALAGTGGDTGTGPDVMGTEADLIYRMILRGVDGLLLASILDAPDLDVARAAGIPVVLLDRAVPFPGHASVGTNFRAASRIAVEHLIWHGHERIGMITGFTGGSTTDDREQGWRDALQEAGLEPGPVIRVPYSRPGGFDAGVELLESSDRPTAIFALSDQQSIGLLYAIHQAGLQIPGDIAVASFDGSTESAFSWPPLTTMRQPVREMAHAAVDLLGKNDPASHRHFTFRAPLVVRQSCGCAVATEHVSVG
jgi:LacI family transcriptional regulator